VSAEQWRRITEIGWRDRERFFQLASFGLVRVQARRIDGRDYDEEALSAAVASRENSIGLIEDPLGRAISSGYEPDLRHVPTITMSVRNTEFPPNVLLGLPVDHAIWTTGNLERFDPRDPRRQFLYQDIHFLADDWHPSDSSPTPVKKRGRPPGADEPLLNALQTDEQSGPVAASDDSLRQTLRALIAEQSATLPPLKALHRSLNLRLHPKFASHRRFRSMLDELGVTIPRSGPR